MLTHTAVPLGLFRPHSRAPSVKYARKNKVMLRKLGHTLQLHGYVLGLLPYCSCRSSPSLVCITTPSSVLQLTTSCSTESCSRSTRSNCSPPIASSTTSVSFSLMCTAATCVHQISLVTATLVMHLQTCFQRTVWRRKPSHLTPMLSWQRLNMKTDREFSSSKILYPPRIFRCLPESMTSQDHCSLFSFVSPLQVFPRVPIGTWQVSRGCQVSVTAVLYFLSLLSQV